MPNWTQRFCAGLTFALALASCVASGGDQPRSVSVTQADIVVAGPQGYCIDRRSLNETREGSFVLLTSCEALARGKRLPNQKEPLLLTASVSGAPGTVGEAEVLKQFFASQAGRQALSRDGVVQTVEVLDMFRREDTFILHARDTSSGLGEGLRADYWRAFAQVKGHIVTASAIPFQDQPVSDEVALSVLGRFLDRIRSASAAQAQ